MQVPLGRTGSIWFSIAIVWIATSISVPPSNAAESSNASPQQRRSVDRPEALRLLVAAVSRADSKSTREALLRGMVQGLEGRRGIAAPTGWRELSKQLQQSDRAAIRQSAQRLSQLFGDQDAIRRALATVDDPHALPEDRRRALAALVERRNKDVTRSLANMLDSESLRLDAIRAYGVMQDDRAAEAMLSRFRSFPPPARRAVIETLATRKPYARELVGAMKAGSVSADEIPSYVARSLRDLLGSEFTDVYGDIPELNQNIAEQIEKFKSILTDEALSKADPSQGRLVFDKTCGACHVMYDSGGKIGPDLTGSNRANLDYLLLNSLAPSADVPESYRTLVLQTVDGRVLTGVLAEEDNDRLVLKMVDQPRVVIPKEDIELRKMSDKSMMPEGQLDQLKRQELIDLVKYMQTTQQVEKAE